MFALIANGMFYARTLVEGLRSHLADEWGQDLLEYALLGGLLAAGIATMAAILIFAGGPFENMATAIGNCIDFTGGCP
jgi:Flp pilus assembly pilin Flp